jgi:Transglycosylase
MKRVALLALRSAVAVVALAGGSVAILFLYHEVHDFRPYLPQIQAIYASMDPEDRQPPDNVQGFVGKVDGRTVNTYPSGNLLLELRGPMRAAVWHYHSFMFDRTLRWHLTKGQMLALYCHDLPFEAGHGLSRAAGYDFKERPDALTLDELARIVAVGHGPGMTSPSRHPERLEAAKRKLLSAYSEAQ